MTKTANEIWANGPALSPYQPPKEDIRPWGTLLENGWTYKTKAAAAADTIPSTIHSITLRGWDSESDALGGQWTDDSTKGSGDTFMSSGGTARMWYRVGRAEKEIDGVRFAFINERPRDVRMPVLPYGSGFLVPIDDTALDLDLGSFLDAGSVTDASKYLSTNDRSHQGMVIDNANGRIFISAIKRSQADLGGWIHEYEFENGVIGDLVASSGELSIGHGDFFAVTQRSDGKRFIWFYKPPSGEFDPGGNVVRVPWSSGVTDAAIDKTISVASLSLSRRSEVTNFDHYHLLIRADNDNIVSLTDLENETLTVVQKRPWQWTPFPTNPTLARQQSMSIVGVQASACGGFIAQPDYCWAGLSTLDGRGSLCDLYDPAAAIDHEIEAIQWYWNPARLKFETIASVWEWSNGAVRLINLSSGDARSRRSSLGFNQYYWSTGLGSGGENASGDRHVLMAPSGIGGTCVYVGGPQSASRQSNAKFDPLDFYMEQWARGQGGRHGARTRVRGGEIDILYDYPEDTAVDAGVRFAVGGTIIAQLRGNGISFGGSKAKGYTPIGRFEFDGGSGPAVRGTSSGSNQPSFLSNNAGIDFASSGSIKFGSYNEGTGVGTRFLYMTTTSMNPYVDNSYNLGGSSNRYKDAYIANGVTTTSDGRKKTRPDPNSWKVSPLTDAELAAATDLAREIGTYRWLSSVEEKGDAARYHVGMTVQRAIEIMDGHGLDHPMRYGFICYDEWGAAEAETVEIEHEDGRKETIELSPAREAGSLYSFRSDQLALFIARGQAQRQEALEARIATLEAK